MITYKDWNIEYNPKPIPPSCGVDYDFWHPDYDDINRLFGCGASIEDCKNQIDGILEQQVKEKSCSNCGEPADIKMPGTSRYVCSRSCYNILLCQDF